MATTFLVRARAGTGSFSAALFSESPLEVRAGIPKEPRGGMANRALVFGLEKLLGCGVRLLSGHKSRRKTLSADCTREELVRKIREFEKKGECDGKDIH